MVLAPGTSSCRFGEWGLSIAEQQILLLQLPGPLPVSAERVGCERNRLIDKHFMELAHLSFSEKAVSEPNNRNVLIRFIIK